MSTQPTARPTRREFIRTVGCGLAAAAAAGFAPRLLAAGRRIGTGCEPRALYWGPRLVADVYGVKDVVITESGAGYNDAAPIHGEVPDVHRLEYIRTCLRELRRGMGDGHPVSGYFAWSFMDNFEWADGYDRRFGLVYNDFKTQVRTPKASAHWYAKVIRANAIV